MPLPFEEHNLPPLTQQAIHWLVRLRSDDLSDTEMDVFADWLISDPEHGEAFAKAEDLFNAMQLAARRMGIAGTGVTQSAVISTALPAKPPAASTHLGNLARPHAVLTQRTPNRSSRWRSLGLAMAASGVLLSCLHLSPYNGWLDIYLSDYHTSTGEMKDIELADGSHVLLNTDSAVSVNFTAGARQITLHHGQVRFTVAKDPLRPFDVLTEDLSVRALGTVFDVYKLTPTATDVSVQEHAVEVRLHGKQHPTASESTQVEQGQYLRYRSSTGLSQPQPSDLDTLLAWQQQRLLINDRPLAELIAELQRYRKGRIFLADSELGKLRITGVFSIANPDEALNAVRKVLGLEEKRLGPWLTVLHR